MYGITEQIKDYINQKIDKNKTFLQNVTFTVRQNSIKSKIEISDDEIG